MMCSDAPYARRPALTVAAALVLGLACLLIATACGDDEENPWEGALTLDPTGLLAIVANSNLHQGENRVVFGLLYDREPLLEADASVTFFDLDRPGQAGEAVSLVYVPVEGAGRGYYVASARFDSAGAWGAEVSVAGQESPARTRFAVAETSLSPITGDPAPRTVTRTLGTTPLDELTTDPRPDPLLYERTVADVVASGRPSVIAFASPALCRTQTCGPALDIVKGMLPDYAGRVQFVHVEVYENLDTPNPTVVPALHEWNLRTEPWVFVVDAEGIIAAAFEGVLGDSELRAAIEEVLR